MSQLPCPCGYIHFVSENPDAAWLTVRDTDMEAFLSHSRLFEDGFNAPAGDAARDDSDESAREMVRLQGRLYECPECGIILWRQFSGGEYRAFRPLMDKGKE